MQHSVTDTTGVKDIIKLPEKPAIILSSVVLLCSACLQLLPNDLQLLLRLDRTGIANLELWRLLSAHLIHLSWNHLLLNAVGLSLLALLFESAWQSRDIVWGGIFCALSISLGIYLLFPNIVWYVGLSGVLHGWFVIACLRLWPAQRRFAGILLLAMLGKLVLENMGVGTSDADWLGGAVIEQAHLLGAIGGLLYVLLSAVVRGLSEHA